MADAMAPTGGPVAVKLLRASGGVPQTCQREYLLASAVDADCTAPALGHGMSTAGAYLVTTYLPGYRCGTTLVGAPIPVGQLWTFGSALARVLAGVHARRVVHCDVKPSNLLIRGEDVRVIDFGIARYVGQRCGGDGTVECSRGWAAPEQLRTEPATPAVDVFAWGCVLAYLAGGVHPICQPGEEGRILRVQSAEPDLVGVPSGLAEVIRQSLARDPRERPSARELAAICQAHGNAPGDPCRGSPGRRGKHHRSTGKAARAMTAPKAWPAGRDRYHGVAGPGAVAIGTSEVAALDRGGRSDDQPDDDHYRHPRPGGTQIRQVPPQPQLPLVGQLRRIHPVH